jgi:hypothetical protein
LGLRDVRVDGTVVDGGVRVAAIAGHRGHSGFPTR